MEILLWLVPPAIVTVLAMAWVSWLGREGRGEIDRDEAVRRLAKAMQKDSLAPRRARRAVPDPSTGVAVRRPVPRPVSRPAGSEADERRRRAS